MGDWDDHSANNSSKSGKNLFSRFRHRNNGASNSPGMSSSLGHGIAHDTILEGTPKNEAYSKKRGSAPPSSMMIAELDDGDVPNPPTTTSTSSSRHYSSSSSHSHSHRRSHSKSTSSSSRPKELMDADRSKSEGTDAAALVVYETFKDGSGSKETKDKKRTSRSKSRSRHRSKSRARSKSKDAALLLEEEQQQLQQQQQLTGQTQGESLRDYWKRRAEESKERVNESSSSTASASGSSSHPPPPPRDESGNIATTTSSSSSKHHHRTRSSSRGRSVRGGGSTVAEGTPRSPPNTRKVDSIASALVGHTTPGKSSRRTSSNNEFNMSSNSTNSNTSTTNNNSISSLHLQLEQSNWTSLHQTLLTLSTSSTPTEIVAQLSLPHPQTGGTVLHVAAWKAPPLLAVMMIRLLTTSRSSIIGSRGEQEISREMSVLMGIRDGEGNTPLHLCCGNLEYREDYCGGGRKKGGGISTSEGGVDYLAVLKEIVKVAPSKAWTIQNAEGDTPLNMLVSSPLCAALDPSSSITNASACAQMALEAVQLALASDVEGAALPIQERTGATPLHVALAHGAHDCVIEALLDAAPSCAMIEDGRGMLPLHWAAAFGRASYSVVKRLIEVYPQALLHATVDGDIPLHLAVSNAMIEEEGGVRRGSTTGEGSDRKLDKNRLKMIELLMNDAGRKSRDGDKNVTSPILTTNREKLTPLHCCALFDAPPQISKLLMKHPDSNAASSMTNSFGATPLHLAAAQPGVSQSIATVLAIGTSDAASVQDRLKRTPLHVAAQNTYATNLLIKTLAELNPEAAAVKTQRGHLPLHLAAQSQAKEPVIRALIKAYPAAAEARNKSNNTPLHDAAKYRASLGVVKLLLDAYPGALYVQNQYGNLPLHCGTAYQAPSDVVQLLLKSWPEAASMQNRNQDAPLHYAAAYATSASAVRPLIEAAPAAVLSLNSSGQSPVDRAKANNAPSDIIELLESAAEEYSKNAASDGWASFGQHS